MVLGVFLVSRRNNSVCAIQKEEGRNMEHKYIKLYEGIALLAQVVARNCSQGWVEAFSSLPLRIICIYPCSVWEIISLTSRRRIEWTLLRFLSECRGMLGTARRYLLSLGFSVAAPREAGPGGVLFPKLARLNKKVL